MNKLSIIKRNLLDSIDLKTKVLNDSNMLQTVGDIATLIINCYKNEGKVLFCGNGGSAADAQHLSAELSGRYYYDRPPLFAEALHVNTSYLTAVANDNSFNDVYARMTQAMGKKGDILIGLSTSGNSQNVVNALRTARDLGITTVAFSGNNGGKMKEYADFLIGIPSNDTPRIQECHLLLGHAICEIVEQSLFPNDKSI